MLIIRVTIATTYSDIINEATVNNINNTRNIAKYATPLSLNCGPLEILNICFSLIKL